MTDLAISPASDIAAPASAREEQRQARIATALAMLEEGATLAEIAQRFDVTPQAISRFLLSNVSEKYREARDIGLTAKLLEQAEKLENSHDHVAISRARETTKFWCWVTERLVPRFAAKQEIGAPGEFKALEDRELARRFAFISAMARRSTIDAEVIEPST